MKNYRSLIALLICISTLLYYKYASLNIEKPEAYVVTTWDVYGYYMYLPGAFIYKDLDKLEWHDSIQAKYHVMGDRYYQVKHLDNGNKAGNYMIGISIMQAPFFYVGHLIAQDSSYPADGFSPPYQFAVSIGLLVYMILAFVLLRWLLLQYFSDRTTALTLALLLLATNLIQYLAIETVQSHAPIYFLYVLVLVFTHKWHLERKLIWAIGIGYLIGLATISRPTELIMFLIPLLWGTQTKKDAHIKWAHVKAHKWQLLVLVLATFIGALPQLLYWKHVTGGFFHVMGSAWDFLTPHFQVLLGFEKGWFIYTPITLFFIIGMFRLKDLPFKKSVIWYGLLNIYIIIAWRDWHYGASYSTRALVQSYPVMALALAAFIERLSNKKWRIAFYAFALYCVFINLFQTYQYNNWILHYNQMNFNYYKRIYLKSSIELLDVSFMDTRDELKEKDKAKYMALYLEKKEGIPFQGTEQAITCIPADPNMHYLEIRMNIFFAEGYPNSKIVVKQGDKEVLLRSNHPLSGPGQSNAYHFYFEIEEDQAHHPIEIHITNPNYAQGTVNTLDVVAYLANKGNRSAELCEYKVN